MEISEIIRILKSELSKFFKYLHSFRRNNCEMSSEFSLVNELTRHEAMNCEKESGFSTNRDLTNLEKELINSILDMKLEKIPDSDIRKLLHSEIDFSLILSKKLI